MGGVLLGLKLGMIMLGEGEFETTTSGITTKTKVDSRTDFQLTVPLNFGGSGFGVDLQPSISFGDVTAVGLYLGPAYHLELNPKLYVNFGLGLQARYWLSQSDLPAGADLDKGADLYVRVPVGATYYAAPDLGLFAELGLGYGAQGAAYKVAGTTTDFKFGAGYGFDIGVGVRWP